MNHRNVVQLFELGEHQGSYFIAMEYVSGRTLRDLIDAAARKREKIPAEVCRSIAEQICDGASYAHNLTDVTGRSLNIIHRDLNPQNVLLSYTGDVKIIDFGIAKSEMSTVKTEAGMIKGKFVYMSPEQLEEEHRLLLDTDGGRAAPGGSARPSAARTPARPAPTPIAKPESDGGTLILNPAAASGAKKPSTPPQPSAAAGTKRPTTPPGAVRAPAKPPAGPPSQRPVGAADTLLDAGVSTLAPHDDVPGGTAMLRPGQPLPIPPARKGPRSTDTMPDIPEVTEPALAVEGDGKTAFLGTAPARPARKAPPVSGNGGGTSILTPEEAQAAAREAMAKLQQSQQQAVRTRTRPQGQGEPPRKRSGRGLWIALGGGALGALAGIAALLVWLLSDEPVVPHPRRATAAVVSEAQKEDPGSTSEKGAASEPSQAIERKRRADEPREQKKPAPKPAPAEKIEAVPRKIRPGKPYGPLHAHPQGR